MDALDRELQELKSEVAARRVLENSARGSEVPGKRYRGAPIYYPLETAPLNGDPANKSLANQVMTCPRCRAHILLSRFSPEDIWSLKARGLSNAEIGRHLNLSRERVRQLCKKYEAEQRAAVDALMKANIDDLVRRAEHIEDGLIASGKLKRRVDRRTKKKRIVAELDKLRTKGENNER